MPAYVQGDLFPAAATESGVAQPHHGTLNAVRRGERLRESSRAVRARPGAGDLVGVLREACSGKRLNDPHAQLSFLLARADLIAATGRKRKVSEKTRSDFGATLARAIDELRQVRAPIRNIGELGRAHAIALTRHWLSQGQSAATIQTKSSVLRRYLTLIGKSAAMPAGAAWTALLTEKGVPVSGLRRSKIATVAKAWDAQGVDASGKIHEISLRYPLVAAEMEMQLAFGLRVKEAIQIHPVQADAGSRLLVTEGTKGGRQRWVDFDPDAQVARWQRDVLERAKQLADTHPKKRLSLRGKSLAQMRNYYYYVLRKHGVTGAEIGVVSHGLRHQFANRRHEAVAGLPAPVLRAAPVQLYQGKSASIRAAAQDTTTQLGHWRIDLPAAYNGSLPWMSRAARRQLEDTLALFQDNAGVAEMFVEARVQTAWVIGRVAYGMPVAPTEVLELAVLVASPLAGEWQVRLEQLIQRRLTVVTLADPLRRPSDGVELVFVQRASTPVAVLNLSS